MNFELNNTIIIRSNTDFYFHVFIHMYTSVQSHKEYAHDDLRDKTNFVCI